MKSERPKGAKGFILIAAIVFIALLLPLVTLILSAVSQETISANNLLIETKTRNAADTAVNSAISVLIDRQLMPDYIVSTLPQHQGRAIIVDDNGVLRWDIDNDGAGLDGIYGTDDDWWIGPYKDRKMMGPDSDYPQYDPEEERNYQVGFRWVNWNKPTYLAENWAWFGRNNPFAFNRASGRPVYLYNQFAAIYDGGTGGITPQDWQGYHPEDSSVFPPNRWVVPGYYQNAPVPTSTVISGNVGGLGGGGDKGSLGVSTVSLYQPLTNTFDTPDELESEVSITDEAGRLNLNIFCKKLPVWATENEVIDFDLDGEYTGDFDGNGVPGEPIWKWIDNPLFPDRDTVIPIGQGTGQGTDFNGDGINSPEIGEDIQHYYAPDWTDYAVKSKAMLMALPGVNDAIATRILKGLNPDLSSLPAGYTPDPSGITPNPPVDRRADVPNLSPNFWAYYFEVDAFGQITDIMLEYTNTHSGVRPDFDLDNDDVPLPRPRPLTDVKQLLDFGFTKQQFDRIKDYVTVFSYDTNVLGTEVWDAEPTSGDNDEIADVRYNINNVVTPATLESYRSAASELQSFIRNHLTETRYKKITLPVVDRDGRTKSDPLFQDPSTHPYKLNPEFSYDSLLSIILYRNGYQSTDAYRYNPIDVNDDDIRVAKPGIPFGIFARFFGGFSNSFIPIADFQPSFVANPNAPMSRNENASIPPHNFQSVADLLEVPLYKFDNLAISAMVDTPSSAVCNPNDTVDVVYLVAFSDVIGADEVDAGGEIIPTYTVVFDMDGDGVMEADDEEIVVDMRDADPNNDLLSFRTPPPTGTRSAIIGSFDKPLYDASVAANPTDPTYWIANNFINFKRTFTFAGGNIPDPDPSLAGQTFDWDGDGRAEFAYDAFGDPFITARVTVIKNRTVDSGGEDDYRALRADEVVKVYIQHNCAAKIPLETNILAIRTGSNTFQVLSRTAGGSVDRGPVYLYNWVYNGFPVDSSVDGLVLAPADWSQQRVAPTISMDPSATTIGLQVFDIWGADAATAAVLGFPYTVIAEFLNPADPNYGNIAHLAPIDGSNVNGFMNPPPPPPPGFGPLFPANASDFDVAEVNSIASAGQLFVEVAAETPSIYQNQYSVIHAGAYGGQGPYTYSITVNGPGGYTDTFGSFGPVNQNVFEDRTEDLASSGLYTVTLTVTDSSPIPLVALANTTIAVSGSVNSSTQYADVPNLTVSAKLVPYERGNPGNARSFQGIASVSGGRPNYLLRWDVRDQNGAVINQNHPGGTTPMTYTAPGATPIFTFNPNSSSDGIYFVYVSVIDNTDRNPNLVSSTIATDVVPVLIGPSTDLRVSPSIYANPPGNAFTGTARSAESISLVVPGAPRVYSYASSGHNAIEPRIAPAGSVIEIRGINFDTANPSSNIVTFEPGIQAAAISAFNDPDHLPGIGEFQQQVLRVRIPDNAVSGFVTVRNQFGTSQNSSEYNFLMTNWRVSFDLYAAHIDTYNEDPLLQDRYRYEVDFQGDGKVDAAIETTDLEVLAANRPELTYDYANDGFGNYQATLRVTNLVSRKVGVSHQLVQMRDLTEMALNRANQSEAMGLSVNILPDYRQRLPLLTQNLQIKSYINGVTNALSLGYKWNVDSNETSSAFKANRIVGTLPYFNSNPNFITSDVIVEGYLDARWATPATPVDVVVRIKYPFDLNEPNEPMLSFDLGDQCGTYTFDMADGGAPIVARGVVVERGPNYSVEEVRFSYEFVNADGPSTFHNPTFTAVSGWGQPFPIATFSLPSIRISSYLTNLTLSMQDAFTPKIYDGNQHLVGLTVMFDRTANGETHTVEATDNVALPIVQQPESNVHSYLAFNPSYALSYGAGAAEFSMLGIMGGSPTLDYRSDINADGRVDIGGSVFPNPHTGTVPLRNTLVPVSAWAFTPGYGWHDVIPQIPGFNIGTVTVPYEATRGVYTGWAMVSETVTPPYTNANRNISVDTQEIMVGGRQIPQAGLVPPSLAVNIFVDPLLGTVSDVYSLASYASGGSGSYTYLWEVFWDDGVNPAVPIVLSQGQEVLSQSYFSPISDAFDEYNGGAGNIPSLAGRYMVRLTVNDGSGINPPVQDSVFIEVRDQPLSAQLFVNPPAGTIDQNLDFWVYIEGGTPPYTYQIDYGDGTPVVTVGNVTSSLSFLSHAYTVFSPPGGYHAKLEVRDSTGTVVGGVGTGAGDPTPPVPNGQPNYDEEIAIGDRLPLNISLMSTPVSGVNAFPVEVHYAIGGGVKSSAISGGAGSYIVGLNLLDENGNIVGNWFGTDPNTFGPNGHPDVDVIIPGNPQFFESEFNGTPGTADQLPPDYDSISPRGNPQRRDYNANNTGQISPTGDIDWFTIDKPFPPPARPLRVDLECTDLAPGESMTISIYSPTDQVNPIDSQTITGGGPTLVQVNATGYNNQGGTFYVRINGVTNPGSSHIYNLRIQMIPPGQPIPPLPAEIPDDDPVTFFVPGPGKYFLQAVVLDGDFQIAFAQIEIYSEGYIAPSTYDGLGTPRVRYTLEPEDPTDSGSRLIEKPQHAIRIWTDPLYDAPTGSYPGATDNDVRLLEADLQILGELFTVDPNPNLFFSSDFSPTTDPLKSRRYEMSFVNNPFNAGDSEDFYDTYTFGRININTASEEVLTALFSTIVVERGYYYTSNPADPDYRLNGQRDYSRDVLISPAEAAALARAVVDYRNSYYDAQMNEIAGFDNFATGTDAIRVSHLPVIGPWDGANPHEYDATDRGATIPAFDDDAVDNVYDNYAGNYYNLENSAYKFYATSDIAIVRKQLSTESDEEYAVYLNNVFDNDDGDGYDARYYITYDEEAGETVETARNKLAVIQSNGQVAYSWMPNPPFQSVYDLYKVLGEAADFTRLNPNPIDFEIDAATGRPSYDESAMNTIGDADIGNVRVYSGPSVFKYVERWVSGEGSGHAIRGRYEVVTNYLADIAPYITTRGYVFRVEGRGALPTTNADQGNALMGGRISRDKNVLAIVDIGPLNTAPESSLFNPEGFEPEQRLTHKVIYRQDTKLDEVGY
jgi:hypothetical protein